MRALESLVEPARVHRDVYVREEIFKLEMERIWGCAWIYVGHESQVTAPGDYLTTHVGPTPVIMVRDLNGEDVNVLVNRCGHRGAQVCQARHGHVDGLFKCPYHGWTFRTDGTLRSQPGPAGYRDVGFERTAAEFGMTPVARTGQYRGFVFAALSATGPDLIEFLGKMRATIDNMADRAPAGEVEVTGKTCHRFRHPVNWKFFTENLHDAMHPMVAHAGTSDAVRRYLEQLPPAQEKTLPEAEVIAPFGGSYDFFDEMGFVGLPRGHGYMGGKTSIFSHYQVYPDYLEAMEQAYGKQRTEAILSFNRHNGLIYPSCTVRDNVQSVRVVIPVSVNETIIESWTFRLKGAPARMLERTLRYSRLINSPASMVGPDDLDCYIRIQQSAAAGAIEWIDMHRHHGREQRAGDKVTAPGTSDLALRNQYAAWLDYMT